MKRVVCCLVVVAACGKKANAPHHRDDAAAVAAAADAKPAPPIDAKAAAFHNDVEPTSPPPPPTKATTTRGDCKLDYAPKPSRDPNPMCKVAGGTFTMGDDHSDIPDVRPAHRVRVKPFLIDQYEVTVAQVVFYLNTVKDNHCADAPDQECFPLSLAPPLLQQKGGVFAPTDEGDRIPADAYLQGAMRYCAWAGKRLPTEAELEFAARHDPRTNKDYRYPWGDRYRKNTTNCDDDVVDGFVRLAPVGTFDGTHGRGDDSSPWGLHDTAGNANEITASCHAPYKKCQPACDDPGPDTEGVCVHAARTAAFHTSEDGATTWLRQAIVDRPVGFRCARSE